jgi:radical SAM superfamily enzyme YgiQ (UPF0313 family)
MKKPTFLLVNPWIYDFAAFNLWARPLGILKVAEFLSRYDVCIRFVDCMEQSSAGRYAAGKYFKTPVEKPKILRDIPRTYCRYGMEIDRFVEKIKQCKPFDAVLITSMMTYWYPGVQKAVEIVRELAPKAYVILGGVYATLYPEHAEQTVGPDCVYTGPINDGLLETPVFSILTSPASVKPYYKLNLYERLPFAPLSTSTGCPFACSYCASGILNPQFEQRSIDSVYQEIEALAGLGVRDFAFYDDALFFQADRHIKPLLRKIIDNGLSVRFHCPNGLHARFIDDELAYLIKIAGFKTVRLSLETVDKSRQLDTGGKIKTEEFVRAVWLLKKHGFTKQEVGAYLMYGLPNQTLEEVKAGVRRLKATGIRINLTEFSPIPNTDSYRLLVEQGAIPYDIDPLLTNNTVFSYLFAGYDKMAVQKLKLDVADYNNS